MVHKISNPHHQMIHSGSSTHGSLLEQTNRTRGDGDVGVYYDEVDEQM